MSQLVLVTGGTGFIAGHTILALLKAGYRVRATIRNLERANNLRKTIEENGGDVERLFFAEADLNNDAGWADAVHGCDGIFHIASPFPLDVPKDPQEIIAPAVNGTLRVLNAAKEQGIDRIVLTSSLVAVSYGRGGRDELFSEEDWTDPDGKDVSPYVQSKTLAEKAAWDFVAEHAPGMKLSVINPGVVLGPLLSPSHGTSVELVRKMMAGEFPGVPHAGFCVVDVRDVAELHVKAFQSEAAIGERFVCSEKWMWLRDVGREVKVQFHDKGRKAPTTELPGFMVRLVSLFDKSVRPVLIELDQKRDTDNSKAKTLLDWKPRPAEEAIIATGEGLQKFDLI